MREQILHLRMSVDPHFRAVGIVEDLIDRGTIEGLFIKQNHSVGEWSSKLRGLDAPHTYRSLVTVQLHSAFFTKTDAFGEKSLFFPALVFKWSKYINDALRSENDSNGDLLAQMFSLYPLTVYYLQGKYKLSYTFSSTDKEVRFISGWRQMVYMINSLIEKDQETINWLTSVPRQKNNLSFLLFSESSDSWQLIDRASDASLRLSVSYRDLIKDDRIRKPYIVFNEDNYNQYNYFDNQWVLKFDKATVIMPQPNDVALYVRLADRSLAEAKAFYDEEHKKRLTFLNLPLLATSDYLRYYDYFQAIISAVTFSYTSIETLANICIPYNFHFVEEGRGRRAGITTTYDKDAIERYFPLRDKLKFVLPRVLNTSNPVQASWWSDFVSLEEIRNETIHAKQSKSQERYSFFLNRRIFEIVNCNRAIISFYGSYIQNEKPDLLFDFPYGFGFDRVPAAFMSNEDYLTHYHNLRNPFIPSKES